ncbi:hypothetical protein KVR01_004881 [Diaporthe batatas]|uniref:uncharacterized protein n=1 Tax=Diaporthe batatas TaxID=748121 RepID=UPI001D05644B|nr:uncharacterized protein KVR01_004881 [Diaporthe batatas]KAG8164606.1 hypothetical protein KVR01_004881 [Diaporthe batatas]
MRIHLPTTWALLGAMFSIAAAEGDWPNFLFKRDDFDGEWFADQGGKQSSVFLYSNFTQGKTFTWSQTGPQVYIVQVRLMNSNGSSILSWCPDNRNCVTSQGVQVILPESEIHLTDPSAITTLAEHFKEVLFFGIDWQFATKGGQKRQQQQTFTAFSQEWAVVNNVDDAGEVYSNIPQMTAGAPPLTSVPTPTTATNAESGEATASTISGGVTPSSSSSSSSSAAAAGNKSGGLTTAAIVGIVVGTVGGLILVSVIAGCFCFRRRRDGSVERGGSRGVQDIIADKEAHTSILERDQPDTPYSEQNSQQRLNSGLGLAGRNESGVDLGIGQAMSGPGSIRTESLHTLAAGGNRNSAVYSSLGGGAASSAHGTPVMGSGPFGSGSPRAQPHTPSMSAHDRSSVMGSPVPRASSQLDRSLSPYRDNVGQHEYGQQQQYHHHHHHVVDGADLVQQEHSNRDSVTARSPSSIYSTNPLDEAQPISPESAREDGGTAAGGGVGGGSSGGASAHGPPGHGRSATPSGISGQYAHLVEEGMTDDEIRRLEEEERALDEAIEQAGTAGRTR